MIKIKDKYYAFKKELKTYRETPSELYEESYEDFIERIKDDPSAVSFYNPENGGFDWWGVDEDEFFKLLCSQNPNETSFFETPWNNVYVFPNAVFVAYTVAYDQYEHGDYVAAYDSYQEYLDVVTGEGQA